ncbi:glutamate receptor 2.2 [Rhynchospora pubera]|uniref:Glutamate receptor n=1 Tax=Rhynchospora pubera TaxID=906938 RepID=A0AAV8G810_9POAL|nr:glutamate receptor 2.2 [Rhynchospora pubera]
MASRHHLLHLTFLILLLSYSRLALGVENSSETNNVTTVKVGVILDTSSWIGGISWSYMQMAMEDFYASHPYYTSRISLVLRDLRNDHLGGLNGNDDAFGAAVAAVDLLKNVRVQAIIGPQTSSQAKFIVALGNKSNVPIISFSAKSSSISPRQTPYFIRTAWNYSSQAIAIASIAKHFNWREVVPVFEDTDSGNIFVPYLVDTLQGIEAYVPYRCKIPSVASNAEINAMLDHLESNRTRVFVVHMSYELALKFFSLVKQRNMGGDDFVWITTYGLTDIVDIFGSNASNVMPGVLGIRPSIRNTKRVQNIAMRLGKKFKLNELHFPTRPTAFGLWAYDTVWMLAEAVQGVKHANLSYKTSNALYNSTDFSNIGVSEMGQNLTSLIESTNFSGVSGSFNLVDGQLQSGTYEITYVNGSYNNPVGTVSTRNNVSINWPGNNRPPPRGWQWPTVNRTLLIGVPNKPGFSEFVKPDNTARHNFSGFSIKVFEAAMDSLPYKVPYNFVEFDGTYDDLVYQVYLKKFDAAVGDVTILANRSMYADFTLPYTESGVRMVVPIKDVNKKSPWTFLEPLTAKLWLTTGAFFILTGITVWFIEHRVNHEFRGNPANQMGSIFYFAFSTVVFAHRERLVSNLSRLVVIIWVFVVLILQQSYTASLTSKLTVEQLQATVTSIDQIIKEGSYVGYLNDSFMPALLKRMGVNESKMIVLSSPKDYNEALSTGRVAAVVDEIPYLKVFLNKYPKNYSMVGPTYRIDGFGFVFPRGSPLVPDVSRGILNVMERANMTKFDKILYGSGTFVDKEDTSNSSSITFHSFIGLFLLTGVSSIIALIIHMLFALFRHLKSSTNTEAPQNPLEKDEPITEGSNSPPMASPQFSDNVQFAVGSSDSESNFGEITSDEGTPGREIANDDIEMPSFGEMLDQTSEGHHR